MAPGADGMILVGELAVHQDVAVDGDLGIDAGDGTGKDRRVDREGVVHRPECLQRPFDRVEGKIDPQRAQSLVAIERIEVVTADRQPEVRELLDSVGVGPGGVVRSVQRADRGANDHVGLDPHVVSPL